MPILPQSSAADAQDNVRVELTRIRRYPVKSCRGEDLRTCRVEPWGLAGDRRWMLVDDAGDSVTARTVPSLLAVHPELTADGLTCTAPGMDQLVVGAPTAPLADVAVHGKPVRAAVASDDAGAWFSKVVGSPVRLVHLDDPTRRVPNQQYAAPGDRVSLADSFPLLLTTEESLAALNDLVDGEALSMLRFRPNVVVRGTEAWAEDGWRRVRIGAVNFRMVKGCDRCVLTTIDPDTLVGGKEPIATLARHRRWDGKTWFGVNLVPDSPAADIRVGDPVEVLEAVTTPDGPLR